MHLLFTKKKKKHDAWGSHTIQWKIFIVISISVKMEV